MNLLKHRLSRLPNYIKAFGFWHGPRLLLQIERVLHHDSDVVRAFRVPGHSHPISLRDCVSDHAMFWQCIVRKQYDLSAFPQSSRLDQDYKAAVDAGKQPLIIDCGGNIGMSVIWLSRQYPAAKIVVIEPESRNCKVLRLNTAFLGSRVTVLEGGIWPRSTQLTIRNLDGGAAAFQVQEVPQATANSIRAYTIDEVCQIAGEAHPLIVKLDIEGAQSELFASNTDWVGRAGSIVLELDDWLLPWKGTSRAFFACLSQYKFDYLLHGENICCFNDRPPPG